MNTLCVAPSSDDADYALTPTSIANPVVSKGRNGKPVTNSRDVATFFGKNHADVLRDIDNLRHQIPDRGVSNFAETPYVHPQNGQTYRAFDMTRDGFTLLAMGFTGDKALQFKLAYIAEFNAMEEDLSTAVLTLPDFTNPAIAARAWADEHEQKQVAQQRVLLLSNQVSSLEHDNAILEPKAEAYDDFLDSDTNHTLRDVSKMVGLRQKDLTDSLIEKGCLYRHGKQRRPTSSFAAKGYATIVPVTGDGWCNYQLRFTAEGVAWIVKTFKDKPIRHPEFGDSQKTTEAPFTTNGGLTH